MNSNEEEDKILTDEDKLYYDKDTKVYYFNIYKNVLIALLLSPFMKNGEKVTYGNTTLIKKMPIKRSTSKKIDILDILNKRKLYYVLGWLIGMICMVLNILLGQEIEVNEAIIIPVSLSFFFGQLIYDIFNKPVKITRSDIFSRIYLIHFGFAFISLFILSFVFMIIDYLL